MPWPCPRATKSTMKTMCGTRATALRPYWTSRARTAGEAWSCFALCEVAASALDSAGQLHQLASVSTDESAPSPYQLCCKPCWSSSHQRARRGDAEPDARKDHAADDAAPRGRSVRQNDGGRQHHDDSSGEAGQEVPAYAAVASAVAGRGVARMYSYQVAEQVARGELEIVLASDEDPEMPAHVDLPAGPALGAQSASLHRLCRAPAEEALCATEEEHQGALNGCALGNALFRVFGHPGESAMLAERLTPD
jgi:hypothetical protein